jgi:regulator of sigma E protease
MDTILTIVALVLIFSLLVFIHELGHFLAAKFVGVPVEEFALGFGRNLWKKEFRGTTYKLNLFPLGGYVQLEGEDRKGDSPQSFHKQPLRNKIIVFCAGVVMNLLLAIILFAGYLHISNYNTQIVNVVGFNFLGTEKVTSVYPIIIRALNADSALQNKVNVGEAITAIANRRFTDLTGFRAILGEYVGQTTNLTILNLEQGTERDIQVKLSSNADSILGVAIVPPKFGFYQIKYPVNLFSAIAHTYNMAAYQLPAVGGLISKSFQESDASYAAQSVSGIVGVSAVVNQLVITKEFLQLLNLTALVSVSLAVVNLLPLPILDGGQVLIAVIERSRRKKLSDTALNRLNIASFAFIVLLTLAVTLKDLWQFDVFNQIANFVRKVLSI